MLLTNLHIFAHLRCLNVLSELVLESDDLGLQQANFFHKILEELVLVDFAALFSEQLHFFFGHGKNQHLLVFV